jgi:APA family basic amino acid/polyamine antiporter
MIGAGVFTTSGFALADLGSPIPVLVAWVAGGVLALCGALSYAGLARQIPGNGGEYLFLSRKLHPLMGFLAGWVSLLAGFTAPIAVAAHGLEAYARGSFGFDFPDGVLGAGAIVLAGLTHGIARAPGLRLQDFAVAIKLLAIVAFILAGAFVLGSAESATTVANAGGGAATGAVATTWSGVSISAFAVTLVWISFAYAGWNAAVYVAGELEEPERTLPRALVMATLGVTAVYVSLNAVFLFAAPIDELAGKAEIGAIAAEALGGPAARAALSGVVALGLLTSISAMIMVGPRVYAQMADDGVLPRSLGSGVDAPHRAIAFQVGLSLIAFFMSDLRELLLYVGFLLGLSAAATVSCLFLKSMRENGARPPMLGFPWVPGLFIGATLGSAGFMVYREPVQAAAGFGTLILGALVYFVTVRGRGASGGAAEPADG